MTVVAWGLVACWVAVAAVVLAPWLSLLLRPYPSQTQPAAPAPDRPADPVPLDLPEVPAQLVAAKRALRIVMGYCADRSIDAARKPLEGIRDAIAAEEIAWPSD